MGVSRFTFLIHETFTEHSGGGVSARNQNSKMNRPQLCFLTASQSMVRSEAFPFASKMMAHISLLCHRKNPPEAPRVQRQNTLTLTGWNGAALTAFGNPPGRSENMSSRPPSAKHTHLACLLSAPSPHQGRKQNDFCFERLNCLADCCGSGWDESRHRSWKAQLHFKKIFFGGLF